MMPSHVESWTTPRDNKERQMADLADGETAEIKGSAKKPYVLKNTGGVYSCTCPAWRNQSLGIEQRTCKHLRKLRGEAAEKERIGKLPERTTQTAAKPDAPALLLAHRWENDGDLRGWWMSEKLDGVRAYWDGKSFFSRLGNRFIAPDWFTAGLPDTPLDGELWAGRKQFQKTVSIVRRQDAGKVWESIRYLIFDAPSQAGPFEQRMEFINHLFETPLAYAAAHEHQICDGLEHMQRELARVEQLGGEGLMLREPESLYEAGRSKTLLKVKTFFDAEAKVMGHQAGRGRHKGRLGALEVITPEGTNFSVGTGLSDAERDNPPVVGSIVTYRYQELSDNGVPRFPSFIGVRMDFEWPGDAVAEPKKADSPGETSTRRFELVDGSVSKFWEITVAEAQHQVRYGRIGSEGQIRVKSFPDPEAAQRDADKLADAKMRKGYVAT